MLTAASSSAWISPSSHTRPHHVPSTSHPLSSFLVAPNLNSGLYPNIGHFKAPSHLWTMWKHFMIATKCIDQSPLQLSSLKTGVVAFLQSLCGSGTGSILAGWFWLRAAAALLSVGLTGAGGLASRVLIPMVGELVPAVRRGLSPFARSISPPSCLNALGGWLPSRGPRQSHGAFLI